MSELVEIGQKLGFNKIVGDGILIKLIPVGGGESRLVIVHNCMAMLQPTSAESLGVTGGFRVQQHV